MGNSDASSVTACSIVPMSTVRQACSSGLCTRQVGVGRSVGQPFLGTAALFLREPERHGQGHRIRETQPTIMSYIVQMIRIPSAMSRGSGSGRKMPNRKESESSLTPRPLGLSKVR